MLSPGLAAHVQDAAAAKRRATARATRGANQFGRRRITSYIYRGRGKGVKLSLPSFPEGLVAAALRLGRRHLLRRRRVHHGAGEAAGVPRRRRRLHVRLPRRQRGRRRRVASRRRVRCLAEATETEKPRAQFSSAVPKPVVDQGFKAWRRKKPKFPSSRADHPPVTGACCWP